MSRWFFALVVLSGCGRCGRSAPVVSVMVATSMPGASAAELETSVASPIEAALSPLPGVKELRSTVRDGAAFVLVDVEGKQPEEVALSVHERLRTIGHELPQAASPPAIEVRSPQLESKAVILRSSRLSPIELSEVAGRYREALAPRQGVRQVQLCGVRDRVLRISVDRHRMEALQLEVKTVLSAARQGEQPEELAQARLNDLVRLSDVATIVLDARRPTCRAFADGADVLIARISSTGPVDTSWAERPADVELIEVPSGPAWALRTVAPQEDEAWLRRLSKTGAVIDEDGLVRSLPTPPDVPGIAIVVPPRPHTLVSVSGNVRGVVRASAEQLRTALGPDLWSGAIEPPPAGLPPARPTKATFDVPGRSDRVVELELDPSNLPAPLELAPGETLLRVNRRPAVEFATDATVTEVEAALERMSVPNGVLVHTKPVTPR